ncbi:hypothetical protein ONZ45_g610 [Pleurotus djamor]|nr:hypothetical protein ONZ45_g610 [Pleurotus djamor]
MASPSISPAPLHSSQQRNPISTRLYKILGTNFDDQDTKEALQTLSDLYAAQPPSSTGRGSDSTRVLDENTDTLEDELGSHSRSRHTALQEAIPGESAARARKHLKKDMENKLAEGSRDFLNALGEVSKTLQTLQEHIDALHVGCDEAETQLAFTQESSKSILEHAGNLNIERTQVERKISVVELFLAKFTLSEDEIQSLTSPEASVGQSFFQTMDKTERIRDDCMILMSGEEGPTKAGLDIISATSSYLEDAYDKLINCEALSQLSDIRQSTLLSLFLAALTRGGPSGLPRPIELHAHDPIRYVGDMLAWVHQAIAAEREFLEGLFDVKTEGRMVGSVRKFTVSEEEEWIRELMDMAVAKLCVPLKVRVQQTIRSQESSIMSYKIANLLQFYMLTMSRTIGESALLSKTLKE